MLKTEPRTKEKEEEKEVRESRQQNEHSKSSRQTTLLLSLLTYMSLMSREKQNEIEKKIRQTSNIRLKGQRKEINSTRYNENSNCNHFSGKFNKFQGGKDFLLDIK